MQSRGAPNLSSASFGLRKLGFASPTPTNGSDPGRCPWPRSDNASVIAPPFLSRVGCRRPPRLCVLCCPRAPIARARPQSCAYLGAPTATKTRHPFAFSRSARPGNGDAAPVPASRYPNPVSGIRVRAPHTIYGQKGIEGGADPKSSAAAWAPQGGAEPSRAEPGEAEPNRAEAKGAKPRETKPRRAEPSREEPSASRAQRPESEQKGLA